MDYLANQPQFNSLSLPDLLKARDQFHPHLLHKANVVGTAVGRYLIRKDDPFPTRDGKKSGKKKRKPPRTLENSEVREYSWPAVLVFVSRWADDNDFSPEGRLTPSDYVPKTIYLEDGRSVPICIVLAPLAEAARAPVDIEDLKFPDMNISGGYPVINRVQGVQHVASLGCLVTDGHRYYALTNRHVTGRPGEELYTRIRGKEVRIGVSSDKQIGRLAFEDVYRSWPGRSIYVNVDAGLIEIDDQTKWSPAVFGIGQLGPLADLSIFNLTLSLIGCPVRAYGCASGRLFGRIAALFYRYKSVGGFEYVADFLIGARGDQPLLTRPGDSGTIWVVETDNVRRDLMPIAVQWGGAVFSTETSQLPFALATNLSTICRELEVDLFRSRGLAAFEYWEAVGHYTIGSFACEQVGDATLKDLMMVKNRRRISFDPDTIDTSVNDVTVPGFVQLANVPDKVWKKKYDAQDAPYGRKGNENPNHYADIDYEDENGDTLDSLTPTAEALDPQAWRDYYKSIGWNSVSQRGLVPFRVWQIYKKMVEFVQAQDVEQYIAAAGVLAHYVGDSCQPLHGSYMSDGDPFRHPDGSPSNVELGLGAGYGGGIHGAYEGDLLNVHVDDFITGLKNELGASHGMELVHDKREAGFAIIELIRRSQGHIKPRELVERYGDLLRDDVNESDRIETLWAEFGAKTIMVMADGARTLAMLWESAWVEGGGSNIPEFKLKTISRTRLQEIYEARDFLPSAPLGQIDQHL